MKSFITTVRALAILQGLFLVTAALLDVFGLVQYSEATPPLAERAAHSGPLVAAGGLLLLPYRAIATRGLRITIGCGLCLVVAWVLYLSADGVTGYILGKKSWHVVPLGILFSAVAVGNVWAFIRITAGGPTQLLRRGPSTV